jgi:hypothetical protein
VSIGAAWALIGSRAMPSATTNPMGLGKIMDPIEDESLQ